MTAGTESGVGTRASPVLVLVVEALERVSETLREQAGEESSLVVKSVHAGEQALKQIEASFYDAVVIEIPQPHMTAEDLFRRIVAHDMDQAVRVLFVAADLNDPETLHFLTWAARPFVTKPVDPVELHELVMRVAAGTYEA